MIAGGSKALSVLTQPHMINGSLDYMLVIQSLFDQGILIYIDEFIKYGHKKGLKILLEVHTKQEFQNALKTESDLIGINNRNLDTLEIDLKTTERVLEGYKNTRPI